MCLEKCLIQKHSLYSVVGFGLYRYNTSFFQFGPCSSLDIWASIKSPQITWNNFSKKHSICLTLNIDNIIWKQDKFLIRSTFRNTSLFLKIIVFYDT